MGEKKNHVGEQKLGTSPKPDWNHTVTVPLLTVLAVLADLFTNLDVTYMYPVAGRILWPAFRIIILKNRLLSNSLGA